MVMLGQIRSQVTLAGVLLALPLAAAAANVLMLPRLIVGFYYLS